MGAPAALRRQDQLPEPQVLLPSRMSGLRLLVFDALRGKGLVPIRHEPRGTATRLGNRNASVALAQRAGENENQDRL